MCTCKLAHNARCGRNRTNTYHQIYISHIDYSVEALFLDLLQHLSKFNQLATSKGLSKPSLSRNELPFFFEAV